LRVSYPWSYTIGSLALARACLRGSPTSTSEKREVSDILLKNIVMREFALSNPLHLTPTFLHCFVLCSLPSFRLLFRCHKIIKYYRVDVVVIMHCVGP
jgi:hypothetical protein